MGFPKKSLGQHFLIDPNIRSKIVASAELSLDDRVVEIGPGRGFLTAGLVDAAKEVLAIEIDRGCFESLRERFPDRANLRLVLADALDYPYGEVATGFKVVSNLPYYLSTPLIFRLLEERDRISRMVLMIQKEVAQRLAAPPGSKGVGALSIAVQFVCEVRVAFQVSTHCFRPRPKVTSAVVVLVPRKDFAVKVKDPGFFLRLVRRVFLHRRKSLRNSLAHTGLALSSIGIALAESGIDPGRRPETLAMAEFALLSDRLFETGADL